MGMQISKNPTINVVGGTALGAGAVGGIGSYVAKNGVSRLHVGTRINPGGTAGRFAIAGGVIALELSLLNKYNAKVDTAVEGALAGAAIATTTIGVGMWALTGTNAVAKGLGWKAGFGALALGGVLIGGLLGASNGAAQKQDTTTTGAAR